MRIFMFAPQSIPLPPQDYGGTQRVICALAGAMGELGQEVFVGAPAGSGTIAGAKAHVIASKFGPRDGREDYLADIAARIPPVDIVHLHGGWQRAAVKRECPMLCTLHGNGETVPECPVSFLSDSHRRSYGLPRAPYIYDTVMLEEIAFREIPAEYFLWLGGLQSGERKGVFLAIHAAKRAGVKLVIAGTQGGEIMKRLKRECDGSRTYVGPVAGLEKRKLLSRARALIFPALWSEPCGVTMLEALMCGVPVIGSGEGSQGEVLNGKIGFRCGRDVSSYVRAIRSVRRIRRRDCQAFALKRFHPRVIARQYLELYRKLIREARHGEHGNQVPA